METLPVNYSRNNSVKVQKIFFFSINSIVCWYLAEAWIWTQLDLIWGLCCSQSWTWVGVKHKNEGVRMSNSWTWVYRLYSLELKQGDLRWYIRGHFVSLWSGCCAEHVWRTQLEVCWLCLCHMYHQGLSIKNSYERLLHVLAWATLLTFHQHWVFL